MLSATPTPTQRSDVKNGVPLCAGQLTGSPDCECRAGLLCRLMLRQGGFFAFIKHANAGAVSAGSESGARGRLSV
jgi:hypothetical protein